MIGLWSRARVIVNLILSRIRYYASSIVFRGRMKPRPEKGGRRPPASHHSRYEFGKGNASQPAPPAVSSGIPLLRADCGIPDETLRRVTVTAIGTTRIAISSRANFVNCRIPETTCHHLAVRQPLALYEGDTQDCRIGAADIACPVALITGIEIDALSPHVPPADLIAIDRLGRERSSALIPRANREIANPAREATSLSELGLALPPVDLLGGTALDRHVPSPTPPAHQRLAPRLRTGTARADLTPEDWLLLWRLLQAPLRVDELLSKELPGSLYPYQVEGVKRLIVQERFLLADEMGTGKTVQVCAALTLLWRLGRIRRVLVVCPKTALSVWTSHVREWVPAAAYGVYDQGMVTPLTRTHALTVQIVPYSRLSTIGTSWRLVGGGDWDVIVFDEIHNLRNVRTKRYRAAQELVQTARYRWGLSGTPIQNRIDDLAAVVALICPEIRIDPRLTSPDLVRERIRPIIRRVRRKDVLPHLPEKRRRVMWLDMAPMQRQEYERALRGAQETFQQARQHVVALQLLARLQHICNFPSAPPSPKCETLKDLVRRIVGNNEKVVIFTRFLGYGVYRLEMELSPFGLVSIHGQTSGPMRQEAIERFQSDPRCRIFVSTVQTGGVGITLTAANHVVHFDHWWNPAVAWQAEDRVYRIGQTKTVFVYELWMKDSVEERIQNILTEKGLLHEEIIEHLSEKEFKRHFTLNDLERILGIPCSAR